MIVGKRDREKSEILIGDIIIKQMQSIICVAINDGICGADLQKRIVTEEQVYAKFYEIGKIREKQRKASTSILPMSKRKYIVSLESS